MSPKGELPNDIKTKIKLNINKDNIQKIKNEFDTQIQLDKEQLEKKLRIEYDIAVYNLQSIINIKNIENNKITI